MNLRKNNNTSLQKIFLSFSAFFIFLTFFNTSLSGQKNEFSDSLKIMFYNAENLFDIYNDSLTTDGEFTPLGSKKWTAERFENKINNIYKSIIATGGWYPPAIIGFCEIENFYVLNELVYNTPFSKFQYNIIHKNSPDKRGIDVALIYNTKFVKLIDTAFLKISFPENPNSLTRDILYARLVLKNNDTLHVFVNHWPSRRGGITNSESKRMFVSKTLKNKVDSILKINYNSNIIITGDFNDTPLDKSLRLLINNRQLINLATEYAEKGRGTYKYRESWFMFDQVIISKNLLNKNSTIQCNKMFIAGHEFLLEEDKTYVGLKPKKTYSGKIYTGGTSDHLPVFINLYFNN